MTTLNNGELLYNGCYINGTLANCSLLPTAKGLFDMADVRSADTARPGADGYLAGQDYLGQRIITLDLEIYANANGTRATNLAAVMAAFTRSTNTERPLEFKLPDFPQQVVYCRTRKRDDLTDLGYIQGESGLARVSVQLVASDPRIYSDTKTSVVAALPLPAGGLTFPLTFPVTFSTSSPSTVQATNVGNVSTYPTVTITGPCTNPSISNDTKGRALTMLITLGASDSLVIDMQDHTITLNGGNRFASKLPGSEFWSLGPGTSTLRFTSDDLSATAATATFTFQSAWS